MAAWARAGQSGDAASPALRDGLDRRSRCGLPSAGANRRGAGCGTSSPLPFENVSVEIEAEGVKDLVGVVSETHRARRHGVAVPVAAGKPACRHGIEKRDGVNGTHIPAAAALHAIARRVGHAQGTVGVIELRNGARGTERRAHAARDALRAIDDHGAP